MTAYGYLRCSTDEQAASGLGLDAQRASVTAYATLRGLLPVTLIADEGVSGAKPIADRPGGKRLLAALKPGDHVILFRVDRGFRDAADCLQCCRTWRKQKITLHLADLGGNAIDTSTAGGKMMLGQMALYAEFERDLICDRTRAALGQKRKRGERTGEVPYGWSVGEGGKLAEVPAEQEALAMMRRRHGDGVSLREIAICLELEGFPTKKGNRHWSPATIAGILANRRGAPTG